MASQDFFFFFNICPLDGRKTTTAEQCCVTMPSHSALIRFEADGKNRQNGRMLPSACRRSNLCIPKTSNQVGKHMHTHICKYIHTAATSGCDCLSSSISPSICRSIQANLPLKWHWLCRLCLPRRIWRELFYFFFFSTYFFFYTNALLFEVLILLFCLYLVIRGPSSLSLHTSGGTGTVPGECFSLHCPGFSAALK